MRRTPAFTATTAPVAVIGTIALSLTASPGYADEGVAADRVSLRTLPQAGVALESLAAKAAAGIADARSKRATKTHTVSRGDTVSAIAARHGLRTRDVLAWNDLGWKSIIHPGDVLVLSAAGSAVKESGGQRSADKASSSSRTPTRAAGIHTVRAGDTLWAIARSAGVGLSSLLRANDLNASSIIYPGEKLTIPGTTGSSTQESPSKASTAATSQRAAAKKVHLDAEQVRGVKTIIAVGRDLGVPDKGIAIALATAMVESWIRNVDYGTHDSLGLFQQRPSMGWGTVDQVQDPHHATAAFFGGPGDPNGTATRGLLDIDGWRDMEFGAAAQAVQVSAYPDRYATWESQAYTWLEIYG